MSAASVIIASDFWARVGEPAVYPRNIERAIGLTLPVAVLALPSITVDTVRDWMAANGVNVFVPACPGTMAGCLVAHRGAALIFVCASDPEDERRVTVAHELAHLLRHYLLPREEAIRALGHAIVAVLDGDRAPTFGDGARAVLASVRLGAHVHILPRPDREGVVAIVEREADNLALELVAPRSAILAQLGVLDQTNSSPEVRRAELAKCFGVPARWFRRFVPDTRSSGRDPLAHLLTSLRRNS